MQKTISSKSTFVEGIASQRPAGLPSFGPEKHYFKDLQVCLNPLEIIHSHIEEQCRQNRPEPVGKRTPCLPDTNVKELLTIEPEFTTFSKQFLEEKHNHLKSAKVGEAMPTNSKPSHVTNLSQTFGRIEAPSESLYATIMPIKSDEQVNRECAEFHRGRIISHNHFFPAEQINRGYTKPFERYGTFGISRGGEPNGTAMKKCLAQSDEHLTVVNKTWMNYTKRTKAPLGKKYEKYLYKVPDPNFGSGLPGKRTNKIMFQQEETLLTALSYLNQLRLSLKKRNDFFVMDLISRLEKIDKENTGHMPLSLIVETMYKLHIPMQAFKIRTILSHFQLIIDEGLATERVNYDKFSRLLSIRENLPDVKPYAIVPEDMDNKETTYRLFTKDRLKKPVEGRVYTAPSGQKGDDNVHLSEIISPNLSTQIGLGASDFGRQRDKAQMERIFGSVISKEDFEAVWQGLMQEQKEANEQDGQASVNQFRAKIEKERPPAN